MRKYEIMYIIRPTVEDEAKKALIERFDEVLTSKRCRNHRVERVG